MTVERTALANGVTIVSSAAAAVGGPVGWVIGGAVPAALGADWLVSSDKALLKLARKLQGRYDIIKPEQAMKRLPQADAA